MFSCYAPTFASSREENSKLSFLATNEGTVCNNRFKSKDIHKGTWQYPKSKEWQYIDYVIMKRIIGGDVWMCL